MNAITRLRTSVGLSQSELAARLGVTQSAVSQWETGETHPTFEKMSTLTKILGCSAAEIFNDSSDETEQAS